MNRRATTIGMWAGIMMMTLTTITTAQESPRQETEILIPISSAHSFHDISSSYQRLGITESMIESMSGPAFGQEAFDRWSTNSWTMSHQKNLESPFCLWWPTNVTPRGALLFSMHHDSRGFQSRELRDYCQKERLAYVCFKSDAVQRGSFPRSTMQDALVTLGEKAGHPELQKLPCLVYGFSNGSGAATSFAMQFPERTIAWVAGHPGGSWPLNIPGLDKSLGLVVHGMKDGWFTKHDQETYVRKFRQKLNAPIALAVHPEAGHSLPMDLVLAFFSAALELRDPHPDADGSFVMNPIQIEKGYLGTPYDKAKGGPQQLEIMPYAACKGDPRAMDWLPTEAFAKKWQQYCGSGAATGSTKGGSL